MATNKKKYPIYSQESPSEYFMQAFRGGGTYISQDCCCGRVHFCDKENGVGDWEESEYEALKEKASENPDGYIERYDCISYVWLMGHCCVYGCPCNRVTIFEEFIMNHASEIGEMYETLAVKLKVEAQDMDKIARATKAYNILNE
jgi:hypothetical protein